MNWLYYLLEANLYLSLFYGFYRLFLHKETFYALNRYYLVFASLTAFILPFLQLGFLTKGLVLIDTPAYQVQQETPLLNTENICLFMYSLVSLIFLSKVIFGFRHILYLLKKPAKRIENGITIIELENTKTAFSFFNLLFIDPALPQKDTILKHEMAHINQKHSFDVLLFELIQISSWFNPISYFLKNDVKLIHEYLADEETTKRGIEKYDYAMFLILNSYDNQSLTLANQIFNSSILKRRIHMLNQKKSAKWARLRLLLVLPVVSGMLCTSSMAFTKDYGLVDLYPKKEMAIKTLPQDTTKKKSPKKIAPPPPPAEPAAAKKIKKHHLKPKTVTGYKTSSANPQKVQKIQGVEISAAENAQKPTLELKRVQGYRISSNDPQKAIKIQGAEITVAENAQKTIEIRPAKNTQKPALEPKVAEGQKSL
ncbi:M56 family metallopeptidase [Pedobacter nutrimenti]|uniref:M56 family metallopeptidase n=1 Tax=Pedobacter nutrimenti TaxID=1241337 RepID=UPI00292E492E|nr:M56 family metallopeptidase [Pedobacter nutrimenti]